MADIHIIEITDFNAPELDIYARLSEGQLLNRANLEGGIFIAESPKVIERALDAGCKPVSILMEHKHIDGQGKDILKRCEDIPVYTAEFDVLTNLTGFKLSKRNVVRCTGPNLEVQRKYVKMREESQY